MSYPPGFFRKPVVVEELQKTLVPDGNIESGACLELSQTYRAQVKRPRVTLFDMVRPVHDAMEIDAVGKREHVGELVYQDLAASLENERRRIATPGLFVELRIVTGEAENSYPFSGGCFTEDKIPVLLRIEVFNGNAHDAECVIRFQVRQQLHDVRASHLWPAGESIEPAPDAFHACSDGAQHIHLKGKVCFRAILQRFQIGNRWPNGLEIDLVLAAVRFSQPFMQKVRISLTRFEVVRQPVCRLGIRDFTEEIVRHQGPLHLLAQVRDVAYCIQDLLSCGSYKTHIVILSAG
jgi:hypothetical protein